MLRQKTVSFGERYPHQRITSSIHSHSGLVAMSRYDMIAHIGCAALKASERAPTPRQAAFQSPASQTTSDLSGLSLQNLEEAPHTVDRAMQPCCLGQQATTSHLMKK